MELRAIHDEAERLLRKEPLAWDPRMAHWIPEARFPATLEEASQGYYLYLHALVRLLRPRTVLELGTCEGGSAFFGMLALPEGSTLTTVDVGPRHPWQLGAFLYDLRLRRVLGDDLDLGIYDGNVPMGVDLLMVDTLHEYGHVKRELAIYLPLLSPGAVVVMDDVHLNEGMARAWDELPLERLEAGDRYHWSGLGIAKAS